MNAPTISPTTPRYRGDGPSRGVGAPGAPWRRRRRRRAGLTLIELCVGMVVTAIVLGALSGLWYAVGEAWTSTGGTQAVASTGNQATLRLEALFRQSRFVFTTSAGSLQNGTPAPAAAFLWRGDFWNRRAQRQPAPDFTTPLADGAVQIGELGLLEYDPAAGKVYLYRAREAAAMTEGQRGAASEVPTYERLSNPETGRTFAKLEFVERAVVAEGVTGLVLKLPKLPAGSRPVVEFTMGISRKGSRATVYGTAALRSPSTQPAY